jgi:hypothetical protein
VSSLTRWLSRLQLSPRSQRVLTEAALDWRHEVATAESRALAIRRHIAGTLGLIRAVALLAAHEARAVATPMWAARFAVVIVALGVVPWLLNQNFAQFELANVRSLAWLTLSRSLALSLPAVAFVSVAIADRRAPSSFAGLAVALVAATVALLGLAQPIAWRHYAEVGLLRPGFARPGVPFGIETFALTLRVVAAALLADRLRVDPRRGRLLAGLGVVVAVMSMSSVGYVLAQSLQSAWALRTVTDVLPPRWTWIAIVPIGAVRASARLVVDAFPIPIVSLGLWYVLVRRQERLQSSSGTNLDVVCPDRR